MPYIVPASVPKRITGPQTVNIFAPTPSTYPSERESIAGEATAFANPVIGRSVPAPACFAIPSYIPTPVKSTDKNISVIEVSAAACDEGMLGTYL